MSANDLPICRLSLLIKGLKVVISQLSVKLTGFKSQSMLRIVDIDREGEEVAGNAFATILN